MLPRCCAREETFRPAPTAECRESLAQMFQELLSSAKIRLVPRPVAKLRAVRLNIVKLVLPGIFWNQLPAAAPGSLVPLVLPVERPIEAFQFPAHESITAAHYPTPDVFTGRSESRSERVRWAVSSTPKRRVQAAAAEMA